jgi:hypothetical protein
MLGIVSLSWTDRLDVLGRYAPPYFTSGNLHVLKYEGTSGYDRTFANLATIE